MISLRVSCVNQFILPIKIDIKKAESSVLRIERKCVPLCVEPKVYKYVIRSLQRSDSDGPSECALDYFALVDVKTRAISANERLGLESGEVIFYLDELDDFRGKEEGHTYRPNGFYEASRVKYISLGYRLSTPKHILFLMSREKGIVGGKSSSRRGYFFCLFRASISWEIGIISGQHPSVGR